MKNQKWIFLGFVVILAFALTVSFGCKKDVEEPREEDEMEEAEETEKELPAAVAEAIRVNCPDKEIDKVEIAEEGGFTLYDIEFKEDQGEIEVTSEGIVIDIVTVVTMEELPEAVAAVFQKVATEGIKILRLERAEVHSEIVMEGEVGTLVKLDSFKYLYEAELIKDGQTGEITVDAEGNITEELKWDSKEEGK